MQLESKKIVKSKWQDSTHFSTNYYFFGVYGVKMHILNPISTRGGGTLCPPVTYLRISVQIRVRAR